MKPWKPLLITLLLAACGGLEPRTTASVLARVTAEYVVAGNAAIVLMDKGTLTGEQRSELKRLSRAAAASLRPATQAAELGQPVTAEQEGAAEGAVNAFAAYVNSVRK